MIQNHIQLSQEYQRNLHLFKSGGRIQKIYSTPAFLCFELRAQFKNLHLYLGRGEGVQGLWWGENRPPSQYRINDRLLQFVRKFIRESWLIDFGFSDLARALTMQVKNYEGERVFSYLYQGKTALFFIALKGPDQNVWKYNFSDSWVGDEKKWPQIDDWRPVLEGKIQEVRAQDPYFEKSSAGGEILAIEEILAKGEVVTGQTPGQKTKFLKRKVQKIEADLANCLKRFELAKIAEDLDFLAGLEKNFLGIKLPFFQAEAVFKKRDWIYKKIKKLQTGEKILEQRKQEALQALRAVESNLAINIPTTFVDALMPLWQGKAAGEKVNAGPVKVSSEFVTANGAKFVVGRSALENDALRKSWARDSDWWIHQAEGAGGHIFLRTGSEALPSMEELKEVVQKLMELNQQAKSEFDILITKVKNLRPLKGQAGMVRYKNEKRMRLIF